MSVDTGVGSGRYWAFISYSHKDAAFGRRLHRRLESYVLPRRLVRSGGGALPRRLAPIFRDREEFSAAQDLSAEVRAALAQSRSLIVVCSPAAAASTWVAREVALFRELHPDRPILAAIREGEPADSLPPALRRTTASGEIVEPLAADFRAGRDGWEHGVLKLVAGIVGVGLDELVQRDSQRRLRRVTAVTAGALALVLVMAVLTVFALNARSEAERQRGEAEGLVEFMRTDLREKLQGVGRLDIMSAVNERALQYFNSEIDRMTPESRSHRVHLLLAMGADDEDRGRRLAAVQRFREAFGVTSAQLAADPANPERVFDHAQSQFWVGYDSYLRGDLLEARRSFENYRTLAERMLALEPSQPKYFRELGYSEGDLCSVAMNPPRDKAAALHWCLLALTHMEAAARRMPPSVLLNSDLFERHDWLADAYHANGDEARSFAQRLIAEKMLSDLIRSEPMNMDFKSRWISLQRGLARIEAREGQSDQAKARLERASVILEQMTAFDPSNQSWILQKKKLDIELAQINSNPH